MGKQTKEVLQKKPPKTEGWRKSRKRMCRGCKKVISSHFDRHTKNYCHHSVTEEDGWYYYEEKYKKFCSTDPMRKKKRSTPTK